MSSGYDIGDVHAWGNSGLPWPEFYSRRMRRKRLMRLVKLGGAVAVACVLAWWAVRLAVAL